MKVLGIIFSSIVVVLGGFCVYVHLASRPPSEKKIMENFYAHRAAFERLRGMLQADEQVVRVARWGVETTKSIGTHVPPEGGFPADRYQEYLEVLKQAGGEAALRGSGEHVEPCIGVWASGWAGDTRHIDICWLFQAPSNQVTNLDEYYQTPKPRRPVFRHIDGNWYLWADW
jgi:hypothetical protein